MNKNHVCQKQCLILHPNKLRLQIKHDDIQPEISSSIRKPILGLDCMDPIRADETKQAVHAKLPYFFSQSVY